MGRPRTPAAIVGTAAPPCRRRSASLPVQAELRPDTESKPHTASLPGEPEEAADGVCWRRCAKTHLLFG